MGKKSRLKREARAKVRQVTVGPTEADLEAQIHAALAKAFPWLPSSAIRHQTKFSFNFGRSTVEVDGVSVSRAESRSDVLVFLHDEPLAVLELKRPGTSLTSDDEEQGLSYARVLHPRPPLVVVTNGSEVRLIETHTGTEWKPSEPSEEGLGRLMDSAARIAGEDLKRAVEVLLGPTSKVWVSAIRAATATTLADRSGHWDDPLMPFVADFLVPRKATQEVLSFLRASDKQVVILEGPPLVGKSNVLRELAQSTDHADDLAVLLLEADGSSGSGVFPYIANVLADALGWPVTSDEVRAWLQRLSRAKGPALVLAIDGLGVERDHVRDDLEQLVSRTFGSGIRIVIAVDDTAVGSLVKNTVGRNLAPIGRRSIRVAVDTFDDAEFENAARVLWGHRIGVMDGGQSSPELRVPWVVRALGARVVSEPRYQDQSLVAALPPLLGLDLIAHTREVFGDDDGLRRLYHEIARTVLHDSADGTRGIGLMLEALATFVFRRTTLRMFLDADEIDRAISHGYLKPGIHDSGEPILVARLPELLASETAALLAAQIGIHIREGARAAAGWLCEQAAALPLGDIIAAQAVFDAALRGTSLPLEFIAALINTPPRREPMTREGRYAMHLPGAGLVDLTFRADGSVMVMSRGRMEIMAADPDDDADAMYTDFHAWLILSHLAGQKFLVQSNDGEIRGRVDPAILLEVGTCPIILRRPDGGRYPVLTHRIAGHGEIACHRAGIVEPITLSILGFLGTEWRSAGDWIDEAVGRRSLPLIARIDLVLRELVGSADREKAAWARHTSDHQIATAKLDFPALH